ncbi:MAG: Translation initiation factor IF-2 protein [Parcubacteria group bacterium GW2011_GWD2_42_14]|nr:MAG: Translation initiation factor IF-2 protein [Parcubacteria group bacterium GW2011_GWD2_42_14]
MTANANKCIKRPPVVTVMGHIDHGKSTLLDYIRKTKIVEGEAGGITQHLSAYEVEHTSSSGEKRLITFLDTPGHEAFQHLRSRGSSVADLAILVVAADDGVKPQTLQALKAIEEANIPYLVAISKIDKNNADIEKTKSSLVEHGIYLEGMGGSISYSLIDSKSGKGIPELLDLLLLATDMEELTGDPTVPATGTVIESRCDPKRGISATLLIKNGSLKTGAYVVAGQAYAPLRIVENFLGNKIHEATFSTPIMVVGFSENPPVGATFITVPTKKEALEVAHAVQLSSISNKVTNSEVSESTDRYNVPVIIKSDVVGSLEAIKHELRKHEDENTSIHIIYEGVGKIAEGDIKYASGKKDTIIIGFNVGTDSAAQELALRVGVEIMHFSIIYELTDWIQGAIEARRPKIRREKILGTAKILKCFSFTKKAQTVGCRVETGELSVKDRIIIKKGDVELGRGRILSMKSGKTDTSRVGENNDCGLQMEVALETEPVYNDSIIAFTVTEN